MENGLYAPGVSAAGPEVTAAEWCGRIDHLHAHAPLGKAESIVLVCLLPIKQVEVLIILEAENKTDVVIVAVGVNGPRALHGVIAERDVAEQDGRISIESLSSDGVRSVEHPVRGALALFDRRVVDDLPGREVLDLWNRKRRIQCELRDRLADDVGRLVVAPEIHGHRQVIN